MPSVQEGLNSPQGVELRVLHLLANLMPSGMERMLVSASDHFQAEGVFAAVVGRGPNHPFSSNLAEAGYKVYTVPQSRWTLSSVRRVRQIVRANHFDVIHLHTEADYLRTVLLCRFVFGRRIAIVRTVHSIFDAKGKWFWSRWLQAAIGDRFVQTIVAPSPDVTATETRVGRHAQTVYNWIDDRFAAFRTQRETTQLLDRPPLAVLVGNCSPVKNHQMALQAVLATGWNVAHVGDESNCSSEEIELLDRLQASGQLVIRGPGTPDEAIRRGQVFLMPSRREGMGVALAEALVSGMDALVSDVPGLRWARGVNGVLMVQLELAAWVDALNSAGEGLARSGDLDLDFSATRGAKEYADIYRRSVATQFQHQGGAN